MARCAAQRKAPALRAGPFRMWASPYLCAGSGAMRADRKVGRSGSNSPFCGMRAVDLKQEERDGGESTRAGRLVEEGYEWYMMLTLKRRT